MKDIPFIDNQFIEKNTDFSDLIQVLNHAFNSAKIEVPLRHHHDYNNPEEGVDSTLLLMPAWNPGIDLGVKIITVSPNNGKFELPSIQGTYIYLDGHKGTIKAILGAKSLTTKRTAAASALASSFLSKKDASSLLMIGTGALSINLILAHASVRPIKKVFIWGRDYSKAEEISKKLSEHDFSIVPIKTIEEVISDVDIVSCATLSKTPLVLGKFLKAGQHIDLVGAYKPDMREADDLVISKASIFVDTYQGIKESGDILIPIKNGLLKESLILADLFAMCSKKHLGRSSDTEITCFKSVGHALEDLSAAGYFYKKYIS